MSASVSLTQPGSSALDEETARAELYGVLSQLYYAPPSPELLSALRVAVTEAPMEGGFLQEPWQQLVAAARAQDDAAIAAEYARGRMLLIGTTNLDMQRPVVWNIGAIAASGHPQALDLFRRILLASASIPGAFPPVLIEVEQDGRRFQEMHVDGGAFTQVFLYPRSVTSQRRALLRRGEHVQAARAFVIRNGRVTPNPAKTDRQTLKIAQRAYVMESGQISMQGEAKTLLHDPKVRAAYLGE